MIDLVSCQKLSCEANEMMESLNSNQLRGLETN